jgi:hypothetical protein
LGFWLAWETGRDGGGGGGVGLESGFAVASGLFVGFDLGEDAVAVFACVNVALSLFGCP